jgi:transcriptional regulator with XRE-family HTH domain
MVPALLRDARRRQGLSVRAAAAHCDVPRATWAGWESGQTSPSARTLDSVLAVLGLDLRLIARPTEPPGQEAVRRHLRLSLSDRARTALGRFLPQVAAACRDQPRLLTGPAAVGVWLPCVVARGPLPLPAPEIPGLIALRLDKPYDGRGRSVAYVPPPAALISAGAERSWPALLTAARLLDEHAPLDAAGRRLPAHRDPDEEREQADLGHTLLWGGRGPVPVVPQNSRAWRLDAPATLDEVLQRQGFRARHLR